MQKQMNLIQQMNDAFAKKLLESPFPAQQLSTLWVRNAFVALEHATPPDLGFSNKMFLDLLDKRPKKIEDFPPKLTFLEFATLSNTLEKTSISKLGISYSEYKELLTESAGHVAFYQEATERMRKEVELSFADEAKMKEAMEREDKGFMKPVKAEA